MNIVILFDNSDNKYFVDLEKHLKSIPNEILGNTWTLNEIKPGENILEEIQEILLETDIVFILLSSDFIASDFLIDRVMNNVLRFEKMGLYEIYPILIRSCNWNQTHFSSYEILPPNLIPLNNSYWRNIDNAFTEITLKIHEIIKRISLKKKNKELELKFSESEFSNKNQLEYVHYNYKLSKYLISNIINSIQESINLDSYDNTQKYIRFLRSYLINNYNHLEKGVCTLEEEISVINDYLNTIVNVDRKRIESYQITCDNELEEDLILIPPFFIHSYIDFFVNNFNIDDKFKLKIDIRIKNEDHIECIIDQIGEWKSVGVVDNLFDQFYDLMVEDKRIFTFFHRIENRKVQKTISRKVNIDGDITNLTINISFPILTLDDWE